MPTSTAHEFPDVVVSPHGSLLLMRLGTRWVQGAMSLESPDSLVLDYATRMMGWLLFMDPDTWARRRVLQLGLGAGGLTRFCARRLGLDTTVVEINPKVIAACRRSFQVPRNSSRLQVLQGDARDLVRQPAWRASFDAVQMDAYDDQAERASMTSLAFYRDCHRLLTPDGCLMVNVFGRSSSVDHTCACLRKVFGEGSVWRFSKANGSNVVVLARKGSALPNRREVRQRVRLLGPYWGLEPGSWTRGLRQCSGGGD